MDRDRRERRWVEPYLMAGVRATIGRRFSEAVHAIFLQTSDREEWRPRVALGVSVTNTAGELQLFLGYMAVSYPREWYSQRRSGDTGRLERATPSSGVCFPIEEALAKVLTKHIPRDL